MKLHKLFSSFTIHRWLLIVGCIALILRVTHTYFLLSSPVGNTVVLDSRYYFTEAGRLLGYFSTTQTAVSFMNIGYPYVIAMVCAVFGYHTAVVLWMQAITGSFCAASISAITYLLSKKKSAAVMGGMFYAFYAQAIFYDGLLLTPSIMNAVLALALFSAVFGTAKERPWWYTVSGFGVGIATLLRANSILLACAWCAVLIVWAYKNSDIPRRYLYAVVFAAGYVLVILPPIMYNGLMHNEWVMVSANSGMNFWVGNNAEATGIYYGPSFVASQSGESEQTAFLQEARQRTGDSLLTLSASSSFWRREAFGEISKHPAAWLTLLGKKFLYSLNGYEVQTNVAFAFIEDFSPVVRYASVGFPVLLLLGIPGILFLLRAATGLNGWLLATFAGVYIATCVIFFVSGEYRHPASIVFCIGAAIFAAELITLMKSSPVEKKGPHHQRGEGRQWSPYVLPLVLLILLAPVVFFRHEPLARLSDPFYSYTNYAQAQFRQMESGHTPSKENFRQALLLLHRAPARPEQELYLLEVLCRTHFFASVSYADRDEAMRALQVAETIFSYDGKISEQQYGRQFLVFLYSNIPALVRGIVNHETFKNDAALMNQAAAAHKVFMDNTTIHKFIGQRQ